MGLTIWRRCGRQRDGQARPLQALDDEGSYPGLFDTLGLRR
jgi:hypothetical protein